MLFLYFSGTGNTKYCIEYFAKGLKDDGPVLSIEEPEAEAQIREQSKIVLAYPVYYSALPKILKDYIKDRAGLWQGKQIFLMATMGAFSGDGCGVAARLLKKYGACISGGLHLIMPDCILDVKALKKTREKNKNLVLRAENKLDQAVILYQRGKFPKQGLHLWNHLAGLFGQRLYFYFKTSRYTDKLKIDAGKCIGCGVCAARCPMRNIEMKDRRAVGGGRCTMCYRCINNCPVKAITLIGKKVAAEPYFTMIKYKR